MSQRCAAKAKSTGNQCAWYAIAGGTTCRVHRSGSTRAKAAAARRLEEEAARAAVVTLGLSSAALSLWYDLYERERKSLVIVCTAALKAGVEERRVQLAEAQGQQVAGAIRAILADLGLSSDQQARVSEIVPRHLRLLAGGAG